MSTLGIVILVVVIVAVVAAAAAIVVSRRRAALRQRFGPEYDRAVESAGSKREADRALRDRVDERGTFAIQALPPAARDQYTQSWRDVQAQFVDTPKVALSEADVLVTRLMRDLGYPVDDFDHQADLLSVDHGDVVHNYRDGHQTYLLVMNGQGTTETMRRGFLSYRALFAELLDDSGDREVTR
jgi:hypothetical protein